MTVFQNLRLKIEKNHFKNTQFGHKINKSNKNNFTTTFCHKHKQEALNLIKFQMCKIFKTHVKTKLPKIQKKIKNILKMMIIQQKVLLNSLKTNKFSLINTIL